MNILSGIPVIQCRHIDTTLSFYLENLRFVVVKRRETEQGLQWVHLMHGDTSIMLQQADATSELPGAATISLYFFIDDAQDLYRYLKSRGLTVTDPVETEYRILQLTVADPEGNALTLGQVLTSMES